MAERFTGFWEDNAGREATVATTIGPWPLEEILERIRVRLAEVPAGTTIRIDLIAWGPNE